MENKNLVTWLHLTLFIYACSMSVMSFAQSNANVVVLKENKLFDISYGKDTRNKMDVFLAKGRSPKTPFVLLIHGGGWVGYGKENIRDYQSTLLASGISVASINHRYANDSSVHYTQMLSDVEAALQYVSQHFTQWHIRSDGYVMSGVSSGGHLALLYGIKTSSFKIKSIVTFSAPTNFTDTTILNNSIRNGSIKLIQKMSGITYFPEKPIDSALYHCSPVYYLNKNIPIFIVHGDADILVPFSQAIDLDQGLVHTKVTHALITVPNAGHDLDMKNKTLKQQLYAQSIEWIWKYGQ